MEQNKKQLGSDIGYMKSMFNEKVDSKDIRQLEKKMQDLAPWESVRNIYKELSYYLKKDEYETNKIDQ